MIYLPEKKMSFPFGITGMKQLERVIEEGNYSDGISVGEGKKEVCFSRRTMVRPSPEKYVRMCL